MMFLILSSSEYSSTPKDPTISRLWTVTSLRKSSDSSNMTPTMPSRGCDSPPAPPSLPHNKARSPPREDEEITSHGKPSGDDAQHDLLPMARSKYCNDQHDTAKCYKKVLENAIHKAKTRLRRHKVILNLNNRRAKKWKGDLEKATQDYDKAREEALQIRGDIENIISFISLADKMPASIKPSPDNMTSYKETLADFEERHKAAVELAETYKRPKERISGELENLSRRIKYAEENVQEGSETAVEIEREQKYAMIVEQLAQMGGKDGMKLFEAHPRFLNDLETFMKDSEGEAQH